MTMPRFVFALVAVALAPGCTSCDPELEGPTIAKPGMSAPEEAAPEEAPEEAAPEDVPEDAEAEQPDAAE